VDDGPFADGFEANDDCSGAWAFEIKDTDIEPLVLQPTIFPSGDVDYFKVTVQEVSTDLCWPLDPECNWLEIQLVQPAAEGTHYAFAVLAGNCDAPAQTFAGQQSVVVEWAGKCFVSDGREFWVKVEPTQDTLPAYSCRPYSLTAQFSNKNGHCCTFKSCSTTPECTSAGCGACVSGFCSRP
jgi:hypothetical protein